MADVDELSLEAEMHEVFVFFDDDRDGKLNTSEFACAVRSLGFAPTEDDIAAFERTIRHRYDGMLTEREFENVMTGIVIPRLSKAKDPETEMNEALKTFLDDFRSGDEGFISAEDLELLMKTQGDKLDDTSFAWMMRVTNAVDGKIDYAAFTASLLQGASRKT